MDIFFYFSKETDWKLSRSSAAICIELSQTQGRQNNQLKFKLSKNLQNVKFGCQKRRENKKLSELTRKRTSSTTAAFAAPKLKSFVARHEENVNEFEDKKYPDLCFFRGNKECVSPF